MDKITNLQKAIIAVLDKYHEQFDQEEEDLNAYIIRDEENHHYQFLWFGWKAKRHLFNVAFHAHIQNEKIYMLQDRTEVGIADLLVEEGINKKDIVLAYFSP
ncbi:MAG: element excision factor XisI family protein, partial [Bacteroidota bacterium]